MTTTPEPTPTSPGPRSGPSRDRAAAVAGASAIMFGGAIFGFFYAWVCSTMWGLDRADPRVAIAAMQEMNTSVRNAAFFPAFFLTPVVMLAAAWLAHRAHARAAALAFAAAGLVYALGGIVLTMTINVPMNEDLARVTVPDSISQARAIWTDYSGQWQMYNQLRTLASGVALALAALGLWALGRNRRP